MSIFSRAYRWCDSLSPCTAVAMSPDIAEEFLTASLPLGLAESDVRAPASTKVSCPDATPSSAGTVSCRVSREFAEALFDHSKQQGAYTRLDWSSEHWELHPWDGFELPNWKMGFVVPPGRLIPPSTSAPRCTSTFKRLVQ